MPLLDLALQNLLSPMVLFFALGLGLTAVRSDLTIPGAVAKLLVLYLMMSIGFRGGVELAHHGLTPALFRAVAAGLVLSFGLPVVAFVLLRSATRLDRTNAASVAAHYGSISAVTFVTALGALGQLGIAWEGYMVAVAAVMETPAIVSGLLLGRAGTAADEFATKATGGELVREVLLNGAVVMLLGSFAIGAITGTRGKAMLDPFLLQMFPGFLCLFLLDMGLVAGRGLRNGWRELQPPVVLFAVAMPLVGAAAAAAIAPLAGLSFGGTAILIVLAASASYIAVPAAMQLALPKANAAIPLTLSLGITFPFNLIVGIPLYIAAARAIAGP
jgi:hypothetical protein